MSLYVPGEGSFELPTNPVPNESIDAIAHEALDWIHYNIPFQPNGIYRPELATKGGNCFAQAIGGAALLQEWDVPAGIVLASYHAYIVAGKGKQIRYIDPNTHRVCTPEQEAERLYGGNAGRLHQSTLPKALVSGNFVHYYYKETPESKAPWRSFKATAIRGATAHIRNIHSPHIIVDAAQGIDMLLACGDLARYAKTKPDKFAEEYHNLIGLVPDFRDPGDKNPYATVVHV